VIRRLALVALGLATLAGCAALRQRFPGPDVLFVATPEAVSLQMLRAAAVTPADVVFDLGSGDGRVVIEAARDFGARGVGVEIDPGLVKTSRDAALAAGVAERVTFLWQDLFAADLTGATVVTLYLRDDVNLKLRPKLLAELAPGTRVVSHDFDMGDWAPDRALRVRDDSREHRIFLWLVPADAAGVWRSSVADGEAATLTLQQKYQALTGTLAGATPAAAQGRVSGERIEVTAGALALRGRLAGDVIEGTASEGTSAPRRWTARRAR
jgi:SAM-dependent methyltransferase